MSKTLAACGLVLSVLLTGACAAAGISIVPKPQHMEVGQGTFRLDGHAGIAAPGDARGREIAAFLRRAVHAQTGVELARGPSARGIVLKLDPSVHGAEAYRLAVTAQGITIRAATDKGLFWGVQTLRQLLPVGAHGPADIPVLRIDDAPRYAWRSVMLDVARHFYPVGFIEKQLDVLSYYKINTFHWHLTDDQGWRIQVRRYPRLTSVGAWRTEADGTRYGGFYTQAQIRQVVAYARERNITVIPEIEMPGHSVAAIAAYPELSCDKKPATVPTTWGVFKDIDCVGDPGTFTFLQNVLDEVMPLFPSAWVHIGGDEVPKDDWKDCASCVALMHANGMKDAEELQSYFIKHIQRYLVSKGKTMIGWDEILEGGANKDAVIEIWRGDDETAKAVMNGNRVIIAGPFYLDSPPDKLTTKGVYLTDITGAAATLYSKARQDAAAVIAAHRSQILGAEAPLWSERANPLNAESKLYPRTLALAENLWSGDTHTEAAWTDFERRLQAQYPRLDAWHVAYGPEGGKAVAYTVTVNARHDGWQLHAQRGFDDLHNHYTIDGTTPNARSPAFDDSVDVSHAGTLKVVPFRKGLRYDNPVSFTLVNSLALGKPITFAQPASPGYEPGSALVDGVEGSANFHDGRWAGWNDHDLDATIDLQQATAIHAIDIGFLQDTGSRILPPQQVAFLASTDGQHWTSLQVEQPKADLTDSRPTLYRIAFKAAKPFTARYIRVTASRYAVVPASIPEGARNTWLFADEIRVK